MGGALEKEESGRPGLRKSDLSKTKSPIRSRSKQEVKFEK